MKRILLALMALNSLLLQAQNIELLQTQLQFPATDAQNFSSLTIEVYNPGIYVLEVSDIDLFSLYDHIPFTVSDTSFQLNPLDTQKVIVTFLPEQNVWHEMELVIKTSSGFGSVRALLSGQGDFSLPYYSSTYNLSGSALRTELASIVDQSYNSLGYTLARDNMYGSIDNDSGVVECVYTGRTASFNTRAGANNNSFNTEHTFPQGMFNQNEPMRSDIHHLFPTDVNANSKRGNDPFGTVNNASWSQGGSKSGGGKFEPRNLQKGATARAMMYFVLRYQDYNNFYGQQQSILLNWHQQYAPSTEEKQRNQAIFQLQNNRNPFVDYPQFMKRMSSLKGNANLPQQEELYRSDDTIFLARAAGRYDYDFVLYNPGNTTLKLYDLQLSNPDLILGSTVPDTIELLPHSGATVPISFNSGVNYQGESFHMTTDMAGLNSLTIYIESGAQTPVSLREPAQQALWQVYPNPAADRVWLEGLPTGCDIWLYSPAGRVEAGYRDVDEIDLTNYPAGLYLLRIAAPSGAEHYQKLLVR